jgi:uncharacterized Rmd1/YagE family protein
MIMIATGSVCKATSRAYGATVANRLLRCHQRHPSIASRQNPFGCYIQQQRALLHMHLTLVPAAATTAFQNYATVRSSSSHSAVNSNRSSITRATSANNIHNTDTVVLDELGIADSTNDVLATNSNASTTTTTAVAAAASSNIAATQRLTRRSWGSRHNRNGSNTIMNQFLQQLKPNNAFVPVNAIHAAQTIDLHTIQSNAFEPNAIKKQMFGKNSIVIQLSDLPSDATSRNSSSTIKSLNSPTVTTITSSISPRYMAVFRFGSIVYFNVEPDEASKLTCMIKKIATNGPVAKGIERKENFGVLVTKDIDTTAMFGSEQIFEPVTGDYCIVPELDMNGVAVIGTIMGQTVTLDSYSDSVEELLTNFARINSTVTRTGSFTSGDKSFLFKTVAQNNSIFIDMISKVRIKDRSDTAWNLTKYETIHYGLKEEFVRIHVIIYIDIYAPS